MAAAIYFAYGFLTSIPIILTLGVIEGAMIGILSPASDSYMADVLPSNVRGKLQGMITSSNTAAGFISALIVGRSTRWGLSSVHHPGLGEPDHRDAGKSAMLPTERRLRGKGAGLRPQRQPEPAPGLSQAELRKARVRPIYQAPRALRDQTFAQRPLCACRRSARSRVAYRRGDVPWRGAAAGSGSIPTS